MLPLCANMLICCLHITAHTHARTPLSVSPCHAFHRWLQTKLQLNKQTKQEQIRVCSVWLLPSFPSPSSPSLSTPGHPHPHDYCTTTLRSAQPTSQPHCLPNQPGNDLIWMHALLCISIVVRFYGKILIKRCFRVHFLPNSATFYAVPVCFRVRDARNPRRCTCQIIEMCFAEFLPLIRCYINVAYYWVLLWCVQRNKCSIHLSAIDKCNVF